MSGGECVICTAPANGLTLCTTCATGLRHELADVPDLITNLDITRARLDQLIAPHDHGPRSTTAPLPFRPHIAEIVWILRDTLGAWVTTLHGEYKPTTETSDLARWLLARMDTITRYPNAAQLLDEITDAIHQARRAIDRPDDQRRFLGPCGGNNGGCREELYGMPWLHTTTCPACGTQHNIIDRQAWLNEVAQNHLGTAVDIAGFLRLTGIRCTPSMIRSYARRGRLTGVPTGQGRTLYRIRDVLTALHDRYRHSKAKKAAS
jgi:hypothetical protein